MTALDSINSLEELAAYLSDVSCTLAISHDGIGKKWAMEFLKRAIEIERTK